MAARILSCAACGIGYRATAYEAHKTYECRRCGGELRPRHHLGVSPQTIDGEGLMGCLQAERLVDCGRLSVLGSSRPQMGKLSPKGP